VMSILGLKLPKHLLSQNEKHCKSVAMRDRAGRKYWARSLRTQEHKVITIDEGMWNSHERYDLVNDPKEQHNLWDKN